MMASIPSVSFSTEIFEVPSVTPEGVADSAPPSPGLPPSDASLLEVATGVGGIVAPSPTVSAAGPAEVVKDGESGVLQVSNAEFVAAVFFALPEGASAAACSKVGDPTAGGWSAIRADRALGQLTCKRNNFINCSSFYPGEDESFTVRKGQFAACHFLMLDDIGTKVAMERFGGFTLSWLIETSPGNHQGGIILAEPVAEAQSASQLLDALIDAGLCDAGASGPTSRWARMPVAINGKQKYLDESGKPFACRLVEWHPEQRYTPTQIVEGLQLELTPAVRANKRAGSASVDAQSLYADGDDVLTPKAAENPVVTAFKARGLYKTPLGSGKHDVTCPWVEEHTDALDTGAAYFEPDDTYPLGGFCCQHSHRGQYKIGKVLEVLNIAKTTAKHKPAIRVVEGDLHRVIDAAEKELAKAGRYYQSGGLIVAVSTDPTTGDPSVVSVSSPALTKALSQIASWEKYDKRCQSWVLCDPPTRHTSILYDSQTFRYLPPLAGVARQPYFRESDGELVMQAGYDLISQRFGVFDARQFPIPEPTLEAAQDALAMLEELIVEFHFKTPADKAAALSAIFTAVVRTTLPCAPAYHTSGPVYGSGKSYLCELIGAFAGPAVNAKVSYPATSEEATKVILSLLLTSPAVIEFDDMDTDWIPHGVIKRMLTAESVTDRILGVSKTATVSTRSLFLGSGNNVGPVRDLLRRVLTIHVDPRCATPATLTYQGNPVEKVRKQRGLYVAAVLTIIMAWRMAGSPRAEVKNIVTFSGAWSDYCRHPLIWLGHPDPATSLLEQVKHDPDAEPLLALMTEWHRVFGSAVTTVRKAVDATGWDHPDLLDAMREFPIEEKGGINRSKLGWLLKKNADRIVGGHKFVQGTADGRVAWQVVKV